MNKALLLWLFLPILSFAQSQGSEGKLRFGIFVQPESNRVQLSQHLHPNSSQSEWTLGFNIGGMIQLRLAKNLYFRTALASGERAYLFSEIVDNDSNPLEQALLHSHKYTLETFDINLGLAYDFISFDKLVMGFSTGIGYQVYENLSSQRILMVSTSQEILAVEEVSGKTPEGNYSMTAFASINMAYSLGKNVRLFFEPMYSFNMQPLQLEGLKGNRFQNLAFLLGIRLDVGQ
ncbi:MAG: PorT family protein [Saprospiraceae bacterium]|nr:PorT family protein [Saprospiraceae bacterium]